VPPAFMGFDSFRAFIPSNDSTGFVTQRSPPDVQSYLAVRLRPQGFLSSNEPRLPCRHVAARSLTDALMVVMHIHGVPAIRLGFT